jgi:DHA1 family multidrug resistance protein-like MFS transporter
MLQQHQIIYLAALLMDMAVAGVSFAVTRRAAELGATPAELGLLGATWIGTYALSALMTGRWSDRLGRRIVARAGCAISACMAVTCAFTTNIPALAVLMAVFGLGLAGFWPTAIAWVSEGAGGLMNVRLARFSVAWNIGLMTGFAESGQVFRRWPTAAFFVASGVIAFVVVLLCLPSQAGDPPRSAVDTAHAVIPAGRGFRKTAWLANFALAFTAAGAGAMFPKLATSLGVAADVHGMLFATSRGAALVMFLVLPVLGFWRTRLWPLWIAQAVAAAGFAGLGLANTTWVFAMAFAVTGAVSGYTYQASVFFTMEEMVEKGKGGGLHEAILGIGMALGPLLAGWVGSRHSLRSPYFFCAAVLLMLTVAQMALVFVRRHAKVPA